MTEAGERVLGAAVDAARAVFGAGLEAAFALGSLAHGGFAPLVSDVDVMLVLSRVDAGTAEAVREVHRRVREAEPGELARRLSVFWADRPGVRHGAGPHDRLPAVDHRDLLDAGRLLAGTDARSGATGPSASELVTQSARFAARQFDRAYLDRLGRPGELVADGPRAVTKAVLFPVRFLYTLTTGRADGNAGAVGWYTAVDGPHRALVAAAADWRLRGLDDPAAAQDLLAEHLVGLYREFVDAYRTALAADGHHDLARDLDTMAEALPTPGS